ncbi:MAG: hypothetical protein JW927_01515 [Deltaproteobacteria bacterium]|nr:hypothetical protein [Deltaproteobacteria bacterium]
MKYLTCIFLTFVIFMITFFSCASGQNNTGGKLVSGPAASDIVNYVNQGLIAIAELEQKSLETYGSVTGENSTTDQKLLDALKDYIIPTYKRFLTGLREIRPETLEVKQVHSFYIKAAESTMEGFQTIMLGLENRDQRIIEQGNRKLEEGRTGIEKWRTELVELSKTQGAEIKFK